VRKAFCLTALGLFVSVAAFADPSPSTIMKVTPPQEKKTSGESAECLQRYHVELAMLGTLSNALEPTPAQKPLFDAWRKARLALWTAVPCPALSTGLDIPAPQRIENQITMTSATLDALRKELPAAKALYDALTPEQRKIFDGPVRMAAPPPAAPPAPPAAGH